MKRTLPYYPAFLILLLALVLGGCAAKPKPYHDDPSQSYALNIMRAAGATEIKDDKRSVPTGRPSALGTAIAAWAGSGSSAPANLGLGSLAGAGLGALNFISGSERSMESMSFGFGWVGKTNEDLNSVKVRIGKQVTDAWHESLDEVPLPEGYSYKFDPKYPLYMAIEGPECGVQAKCGYTMMVGNFVDSFSPDSLGRGEAWRFGISLSAASYASNKIASKEKAIFPDLQIYQKFSSKLPPNVFIYLSPSYGSWRVSVQTDQGMQFLAKPLLLNQGAIHQFVSPGM